jgi:hypothetical protein
MDLLVDEGDGRRDHTEAELKVAASLSFAEVLLSFLIHI